VSSERVVARSGCRVLLAQGRFLKRACLRQVIESVGHEVVAEAGDGLEASRLAGALCPDVAVLDLSLPILGGLGAGWLIRRMCPGTRLIAVGSQTDVGLVASVFEAGFTGFVDWREAPAHIVRSIQVVRDGALYLGTLERLPRERSESTHPRPMTIRPETRGARRAGSRRLEEPPPSPLFRRES
jgi:DNA-binding NarL/FixJ family response regulator